MLSNVFQTDEETIKSPLPIGLVFHRLSSFFGWLCFLLLLASFFISLYSLDSLLFQESNSSNEDKTNSNDKCKNTDCNAGFHPKIFTSKRFRNEKANHANDVECNCSNYNRAYVLIFTSILDVFGNPVWKDFFSCLHLIKNFF